MLLCCLSVFVLSLQVAWFSKQINIELHNNNNNNTTEVLTLCYNTFFPHAPSGYANLSQ